MKSYWKPLLFFAAIFALLVATQLSAPKPLNWRPSFSNEDKSPFGAFVLFSRLRDLFFEERITVSPQSLYELFHASPQTYLFSLRSNIIFIAEDLRLDSLDAQSLLEFVSAGSTAFLAAVWFPAPICDTFRLRTRAQFLPFLHVADSLNAPDTLYLSFPKAAPQQGTRYALRMPPYTASFSRFDSSRATVLSVDTANRPNFIRLQFGKGAFYLCSSPYLFTNYYLLTPDGAEYVARVLSHLPVQTTIWDEYYKPLSRRAQTPIRFVLETDTLRYAYYLALTGIVLFIFASGKRRQRPIPLITPPRNATLEFVQTVGRVYLQHGDHKDLAEKKIEYFFDFLRTHFYLQNISFSQDFYQLLSEKSGVPISEIARLFAAIQAARNSSSLSATELLALMKAIENFYNATTVKANVRNALSESN
ncbi:MAG: DUF4350 domain-containing protein [Chloroherpetonaceae bacterium]|nr:DUF4350 domain-containing protein [Chloroherpetonaceae bacterium]MDW8019039.1 DUF4350 domain-containing protein [Chloroherpetonaceae bacterium]